VVTDTIVAVFPPGLARNLAIYSKAASRRRRTNILTLR